MSKVVKRGLLALLLSLGGCGTAVVDEHRADWGQSFATDYFINTQTALSMVGGEIPMISGGCWALVVCPLISLVGLPVDVATDLVWLPSDRRRVMKREADQPAQAERLLLAEPSADG